MTAGLTGLDRFIPVRCDTDRVMTCFLEYEPETIVVHDLVYMRDGSDWTLRKGSYRKFRLSVDWVASQLIASGLRIQHRESSGGVWTVAATRP